MNESYTFELQKLYDDPHVSPFIQEVCEYYASKADYGDGSDREEIEPSEIVEPVYTLFLLQRRETLLDELSYIHKKYPHLFASVEQLYEDILIHMDIRPLESETAARLSLALDEKVSAGAITEKIENLCDSYEDIGEALDPFYGWLHAFYS
ncbi:hypothetical protein [Butyrivibrio sp. INlla16]|uniref:hypothetical protein n=1 Tax=Butyrivibrio sp. INlla16 TaxID=1520807 RepID=UPI000886CC94|nr:hypothetical protein [Butyrivibrio sp. INlla16]SDB54944.1 hypothetical protein SAMN02910263_02791 [Butyrivibrio sp. INlla16]